MEDVIRFKVRWKKCKVPVGEFFCVTGNTETGVISATRDNFDDPFKISCLLSDTDNSKVFIYKLEQVLTVTKYNDRVIMKYFNNKKLLTEKIFSLV